MEGNNAYRLLVEKSYDISLPEKFLEGVLEKKIKEVKITGGTHGSDGVSYAVKIFGEESKETGFFELHVKQNTTGYHDMYFNEFKIDSDMLFSKVDAGVKSTLAGYMDRISAKNPEAKIMVERGINIPN